MKKYIFLLLLLGTAMSPIVADAASANCPGRETKACGNECIPRDIVCLNLKYPSFGPTDNQFNLSMRQSLPEIIAFFYFAIVGVSGLAAFVMLIAGGVQWLTSGAAPSMASEARERIKNALLGLLLILASFLILQVINPELAVLRGVNLTGVTCPNPKYAADPDNEPCDNLVTVLPQGGAGTTKSVFTINGEENNVAIAPGDSVTLAWNMQNTDICEATSNPANAQWDAVVGDIQARGEKIITNLATEGWHDFTISCFQPVTGDVSFTVSAFVTSTTIPPGGGIDPVITIKGAWKPLFEGFDPTAEGTDMLRFDDQEHVDDDTLGLTVAWVVQDADTCAGTGALDVSSANDLGSGNTSGYVQKNPFSLGGDFDFILTCTNALGGSATETVRYVGK